jgi:hypothetical protein
MLGSPSSGRKAIRKVAAARLYRRVRRLSLVCVLVSGAVLGLLGVTSASAKHSTFPGRNGKLQFTQSCWSGLDSSCGQSIATMNADGSSFRILKRYVRAKVGPLSADGRYMLGTDASERSITLLSPAGGKVRTIFSVAQAHKMGFWNLGSTQWLGPDGNRIIFTARPGHPSGDPRLAGPKRIVLYSIGVDGKGLRKIRAFSEPLIDTSDDWAFIALSSPDGRRIALYRIKSDPNLRGARLEIMNANGSGLRLITKRCALYIEDWSPDSRRLLVNWADTKTEPSRQILYCDRREWGLSTLSVKNGVANRIFTEKHVETGVGIGYGNYPPSGVFSPNGKQVAFSVERVDRCQRGGWDTIMVMNANGTGLRTVRNGSYRIEGQGTRCIRTNNGGVSWMRAPR